MALAWIMSVAVRDAGEAEHWTSMMSKHTERADHTGHAARSATHTLLDAFHRRFEAAALDLPDHDPTRASDREQIGNCLRRCLGFDEARVPTPAVRTRDVITAQGISTHFLEGTTWPHTCATAFLYVPEDGTSKTNRPFVLLGCGHGQGGKHSPNYQRMARHLARRGAVVLCPDNIGQGERQPMGHRHVVAPFAAGLSLQGLIVMETLGWLRWAQRELAVDRERIAAIGNSGGGTLTLCLIPFAPELKAMCSTGYPSSFQFIARKEKAHCHCNILPGIARHLEMHHIYGCFAPKPLLLAQGNADPLFPEDLFHWNARQVRRWYESIAAEDQLETRVMPGLHPWDEQRIELIGDFLARHLDLEPPKSEVAPGDEQLTPPEHTCLPSWPADALDVGGIVAQLTGTELADTSHLWEVFPFAPDSDSPLPAITERGDSRQILAQFQAFLEGHDPSQAPAPEVQEKNARL